MSNFISTTIPYVNSRPHVGFALELVQADCFVRALRRQEQVHFQTGTDENSLKNVLAAREKGIGTKEHVDENAELFVGLCRALAIETDSFVRTTSSTHAHTVSEFWRKLRKEDLYRAHYGASYCVGCEDFLADVDLVNGLCPDHLVAPGRIEEENLFFRLSSYQDELAKLIREDRIRITPSFRKKEILNFIAGGLRDFSVTRSKARAENWGIDVPGEEDQIVYVWVDALINYVTGVGFEGWISQARRVHFIGKNVWKFHAVYWPALLLSAGLPIPNGIVVHGFLTENGRKISKSRGGGHDPIELAARYGFESLRFYLLYGFSPFEDGDFSESDLQQVRETYLVNGLGNLLSRLLTLAVRSGAKLPEKPSAWLEVEASYLSKRFDLALRTIVSEVGSINAEIAAAEPWRALAEHTTQIEGWLARLWRVGFALTPALPNTGTAICQRLARPSTKGPHLFTRLSK